MKIKIGKFNSNSQLLPKIAIKTNQNAKCCSIFQNPRCKLNSNNNSKKKRGQKQLALSALSNDNISSMLKIVRNQFESQNQTVKIKRILKIADAQDKVIKQLKYKKKQHKILTPNPIQQVLNQSKWQFQWEDGFCDYYNDKNERKLIIKQARMQAIPPHRYKTQMIAYQSNLIFFGGIGCEKNLTWAKISFNPQKLELPDKDKELKSTLMNTPIYGHTMKAFRHFAYIYGGVNGDVLNQLFVLNLKTMVFKLGTPGPFRRKQHASVMVGKFMVIYGGNSSHETKNNLFYYNTEQCSWTMISSSTLPCLSHHSMTVIPSTSKKKANQISQINEVIYIFGGKNQKNQSSNKLYKMKITTNDDVCCEEIILSLASDSIPSKRFNCCFQYISNGIILLYGGKEDGESSDTDLKNGTFRDSYLFNIHKKTWRKQQTNLDYRQGMAVTGSGGKVFIFGGFGDTYYADGNLLVMKVLDNLIFDPENKEEIQNKESISHRCSIKKLENS